MALRPQERERFPCPLAQIISYAFRPGDLPNLDLQLDRVAGFKALKSQWMPNLSLSGLYKQGAAKLVQAKLVQALTLCFSHETVTIVENLGLSE